MTGTTRNPQLVALDYTEDSRWRKPSRIPVGQSGNHRVFTRKWNKELDYRLIKELWSFNGNRIAVRFAYEWHDDSGQWFRSYGNENWEFSVNSLNKCSYASINDMPISEAERNITGYWDGARIIIPASPSLVFSFHSDIYRNDVCFPQS
jgi:uncharacterized protein